MDNSQIKTLVGLIKVIRPVHWVKNVSLFAALVFSGYLFDRELFIKVFEAFWAFNMAASATYVFNDVLDARNDRRHPIKKNRPVASGEVSIPLALAYSFSLAFIAVAWSFYLSYFFFLIIVSYILLQISYSLYLKNLYIIDILIIATGFIIRVYSGAFVIDAHLSVWFLLCVISTALFLASGKRRAELGVVGRDARTRKSLARYSEEVLNAYVTMFGSAAWLSWALFTFFESPNASIPLWLFLAEISKTTTISKLLMLTIPVTIFSIMRYQSLIFEGRAEAPEKLLLKDKALVGSVGIWVAMVIWILYAGASSTPII